MSSFLLCCNTERGTFSSAKSCQRDAKVTFIQSIIGPEDSLILEDVWIEAERTSYQKNQTSVWAFGWMRMFKALPVKVTQFRKRT